MTQSICLFWDNSNIFHSAQRECEKREGAMQRPSLRAQFDNLFRVATVGRQVTRAYCVGSVPPDLGAVWKRLTKDTGVKPELYERGGLSGKEQGVDQCLQGLDAASDDRREAAASRCASHRGWKGL